MWPCLVDHDDRYILHGEHTRVPLRESLVRGRQSLCLSLIKDSRSGTRKDVICPGAKHLYRVEVGDGATVTLNDLLNGSYFADQRAVCDPAELSNADLSRTSANLHSYGRWVVPSDCMYGDLPNKLKEPCKIGALDIYRYRECLDRSLGFFSGTCVMRFTICAAFRDPMTPEKLRVVIYISLPMSALCALLVAHVLAQMGNCSLMDVEEDRTLRKQVNQKTRVYLEQLQNGHLEYSVLRLGIRCNHLFPERIVSYGLSKGTWWLMTPSDDLTLLNFVGGVGLVAW